MLAASVVIILQTKLKEQKTAWKWEIVETPASYQPCVTCRHDFQFSTQRRHLVVSQGSVIVCRVAGAHMWWWGGWLGRRQRGRICPHRQVIQAKDLGIDVGYARMPQHHTPQLDSVFRLQSLPGKDFQMLLQTNKIIWSIYEKDYKDSVFCYLSQSKIR